MAMKRRASAVWRGTGAEGSGTVTTPSGALRDRPYSFAARFQDPEGTAATNPEELIAAAHAACFSMALSFGLANAGHPATEIRTEARLELDRDDRGWAVRTVHLDVAVAAPGLDDAALQDLAGKAKANCPVSRALNPDIPVTMTARLA